jgi:hypothetical protein
MGVIGVEMGFEQLFFRFGFARVESGHFKFLKEIESDWVDFFRS